MSRGLGGGSRLHDARARAGWWWAEDALFELPVSGYAKLVYAYLCRRANAAATSWPSRQQISAGTGWSLSTVQRALAELEDLGVIEVESGAKAGGPNMYKLRTPAAATSRSGSGRPGVVPADLPPPTGVGQPDSGVVPADLPGSSVGTTEGLEEGLQKGQEKGPLTVLTSPHQRCMDHYSRRFTETKGGRPAITGKDAKGVKDLLVYAKQDVGMAVELIDGLMNSGDAWFAKRGYSLSLFSSSETINRLVAEANGRARHPTGDPLLDGLAMWARGDTEG